MENRHNIRPLNLESLAASISRNYGDDGAIVVTKGPDGFRLGVHNLTLEEAKDALCVAIYHVVAKALI
jgi:hypothetical protein